MSYDLGLFCCLTCEAGWGFIYKDDHEQMIMQDARSPSLAKW